MYNWTDSCLSSLTKGCVCSRWKIEIQQETQWDVEKKYNTSDGQKHKVYQSLSIMTTLLFQLITPSNFYTQSLFRFSISPQLLVRKWKHTFCISLTFPDHPCILSSPPLSPCWWSYELFANWCLPLFLLLQLSPQAIFTQGWLNSFLSPLLLSLHCSPFLPREWNEAKSSHWHTSLHACKRTLTNETHKAEATRTGAEEM